MFKFKHKPTYKLDGDFQVREKRLTVTDVLMKILLFLVVTVSLSLVYYLIFAFLMDTDVEKQLKSENGAYAKRYEEMVVRLERLEDVTSGLEGRDDRLYEKIFHTNAPFDSRMAKVSLLELGDSLEEKTLEANTARRIARNEDRTRSIEANFHRIYELVSSPSFVCPPMQLPLEDFSYVRTGAGVGTKVSPFTHVPTTHYGLDMMAASGDPVLCVADGVVSRVIHSRKKQGNQIIIEHAGGYRTSYAHLSEIKVRQGMRVKKGQVIATVGMSGNSFAPHLHYEIMRDTLTLDPVSYFFKDLMPDEYADMVILSASTGRSMD
ncbi:MAG: M23 family metallopeptidase [Bacteroidales bacterium]|nr:M23 family metallopeptidase [Bacteroidales bacterium]